MKVELGSRGMVRLGELKAGNTFLAPDNGQFYMVSTETNHVEQLRCMNLKTGFILSLGLSTEVQPLPLKAVPDQEAPDGTPGL